MRCRKILTILAFVCLLANANASALQLDVVQSSISFSRMAEPITIQLRILDNGKPQRWDSSNLRELSSQITVKDSKGVSLGQGSDMGLTFVPNGTSENRLFYNLVGVVDRKITERKNIVIFVGFRDSPELSDMFVVNIPEFLGKNNILESEKGYLTEAAFKESISDLESTITLLVYGLVFTILATVISLFMPLKKSDSVTEKIGDEIKNSQSRNHSELIIQGKDILQSSEKIQWDTDALKAVTTKIDENINNFSKNPDEYRKQIKRDLVKFKALVEKINDGSKLNNDELSHWISVMNKERVASDDKLNELVAKVDYFVEHVEVYHRAVSTMSDFVSCVEPIDYKKVREEVREEVTGILMEIEGQSIPTVREIIS